MKPAFRAFRPILIVFILFNAFFLFGKSILDKWSADQNVLILGNLILFIATAISYYFYAKSFQNNNAHAFTRMITAGMFIKLLLCLGTAFIYIMFAGKEVNLGGVIGCMILYMIYTFIEVSALMKLSKSNKNA